LDKNLPVLCAEKSYISNQDSFNNIDLCLFIGCKTALDGPDGSNLTSRIVERGAKTAVGFEETILCSDANTWTETFYEHLLLGNSVEESVDYARLTVSEGSGLESAVIYGDPALRFES
jgi:hypothetical protein